MKEHFFDIFCRLVCVLFVASNGSLDGQGVVEESDFATNHTGRQGEIDPSARADYAPLLAQNETMQT